MLPGKLFDFICRGSGGQSALRQLPLCPQVSFLLPDRGESSALSPSQERHLPEVVSSVNIHLPPATSNHCSSPTCLPQTDWNKTSVEKRESSQSSFLSSTFSTFFQWLLWTTLNVQLSHRGDSPDLCRQRLLESPLQVLHIGRFWPGDEGRAPLLCCSTGRGVGGVGGLERLLG